MGDAQASLKFLWGNDMCTQTGKSHPDNKYKPIVQKDLRKVLKKIFNHSNNPPLLNFSFFFHFNIHTHAILTPTLQIWNHPIHGQWYHSGNTLLLDDDKYKAVLTPSNAIHPPEWSPALVNDDALAKGGLIRDLLEDLLRHGEVGKIGGLTLDKIFK